MRKKLPTRKKRAIWRCVAAAVLLVLIGVLIPRNFTLAAAHEQAMADLLAAPAETLYQTETPTGEWLVLAQSEDTVCLGSYVQEGWLDWRCKRVRAVDREEHRPFAAGSEYWGGGYVDDGNPLGEKNTRYDYVFGCVWDPAVETIEIDFQGNDREEVTTEQTVRLKTAEMETDSRGETWFFVALEPVENIWGWGCSITAYDSQGVPLGKQELPGVAKWDDSVLAQ